MNIRIRETTVIGMAIAILACSEAPPPPDMSTDSKIAGTCTGLGLSSSVCACAPEEFKTSDPELYERYNAFAVASERKLEEYLRAGRLDNAASMTPSQRQALHESVAKDIAADWGMSLAEFKKLNSDLDEAFARTLKSCGA